MFVGKERSIMKALILVLTSVVSFASHLRAENPKPSAEAPKPSAEELLKASDRSRGAADQGLTWDIEITTVEDGRTKNVQYLVKAKGDNALATATAPSRNKGETMLFNDRTLWFFKQGGDLKKPLAISPRQKLMGDAANGDIASTNYYRDYAGEIVGEEKIDGKPVWKLMLKAKAKNVTYDGIRYWISKSERLGVKAEFLTVGGDVFKAAVFKYANSMTSAGKTYPFVSEMIINDALNPKSVTTIKYDNPRLEAHSDSIFNVNNLLR